MAITKVTSGVRTLGTGEVTTANILDGTIANADVDASAAIALSKLATDPSNASNLASGTVPTARLGSGTADATTFLRGDQSYAAAGGDNTPSFRAYLSTNQTGTTNNAWNKINFNTEDWDTDSAYDNSTNYRFTVPAGEGGKYSFSMEVGVAVSAGGLADDFCKTVFYVNGAPYTKGSGQVFLPVVTTGYDNYIINTSVINLAAADYVEAYVYHDMGASRQLGAASSFFSGYKLIGV